MNGNGNIDIGKSDWRIESATPMPKRKDLKVNIPLSQESSEKVVRSARCAVCNILTGEDPRLLAIVGPCSIHDPVEAIEYASKLSELIPKVSDHLFVVMRTCLDKPRTGVGWPGFFLDPGLNGSKNADVGRIKGRQLIVNIVEMGVPVGLELMDANGCQVIDDCVSYWWVGARTVTSQRLRELASGLSTAVGFKNPTDGDMSNAIEALDVARHNAAFLALNHMDVECLYRTLGNPFSHIILRGSSRGPNCDDESITEVAHLLAKRGLITRVVVDASHGNSAKDYRVQRAIVSDIVQRVAQGDKHIAGFMYESYLDAGSQKLPKDLSELKPRISITDGCDDWETTREVLLRACDTISKRS